MFWMPIRCWVGCEIIGGTKYLNTIYIYHIYIAWAICCYVPLYWRWWQINRRRRPNMRGKARQHSGKAVAIVQTACIVGLKLFLIASLERDIVFLCAHASIARHKSIQLGRRYTRCIKHLVTKWGVLL